MVNRITSEKATQLTRSECEAEFLGLDLSDVLWLQFPFSLLAICHCFVLENPSLTVWVFDHRFIAAPFNERLQLVTTGRHGLPLFQEVLWGAAQRELKGQSIDFASEDQLICHSVCHSVCFVTQEEHSSEGLSQTYFGLGLETTNSKQKTSGSIVDKTWVYQAERVKQKTLNSEKWRIQLLLSFFYVSYKN